MGQAKNRGTREQRVIAAIARGTRNTEFTVTGRIRSQPVVQELAPEPRVEIVSPVIESDYAKIEERVMAGGEMTPHDYAILYGGSVGGSMRPDQLRIMEALHRARGTRIAVHTGLRGRGTLALAALAASALAEIGREIVIVDIKEQNFTPEQRRTMEDWYKKEVNRGKQD